MFASARSLPAVSATIVGASPAVPTIAFSTRSGSVTAISSRIPSSPARTRGAAELARGGRGGLGIGEGDNADVRGARLGDQAPGIASGREPDELELIRARKDVEGLLADSVPGGAQDQYAPRHARGRVAAALSAP